MKKKNLQDYNLLLYQQELFKKLETVEHIEEILEIINNHKTFSRSAVLKYETIIKFITVLMGYSDTKQRIAEQLIDHFWKYLNKPKLLQNLLLHAPFGIFQKYFKKVRIQPEQSMWLLITFVDMDNIEELKWILSQKKVKYWFTNETIGLLNMMLEQKTQKRNQQALELIGNHPIVAEIAAKNGYVHLLTKNIKDTFIF